MPDIIHVDMDCFFAAVEVKDNPDLAGKPVIVGALPGTRGVVSACSYEARKFGIHSAMPISKAYRLCPKGVFLPPHGKRYVEESEIIQGIFHEFTPLVEPISLDEAFLDVAGSHRMFGTSVEIGRAIKQKIKTETGLVASVGIAPSKFVAKIASDLKKPDGFVVVEDNTVLEFLAPLDVRKIWGVGQSTAKKMEKLGIRTVADVRKFPVGEFERLFGAHGRHLHDLAHGIDDRTVTPESERKQVGAEFTFDVDTDDIPEIERTLLWLSDKVATRMMKKDRVGSKITLKLRDETFHTITRCRSLDKKIRAAEEIYKTALDIFRGEKMGKSKVRLIGVSVSGFEDEEQMSLFESGPKKTDAIEKVMADIRGRFGKTAITRATLIHKEPAKKKPENV